MACLAMCRALPHSGYARLKSRKQGRRQPDIRNGLATRKLIPERIVAPSIEAAFSTGA